VLDEELGQLDHRREVADAEARVQNDGLVHLSLGVGEVRGVVEAGRRENVWRGLFALARVADVSLCDRAMAGVPGVRYIW
jgi:hypothetical protein